MLEFSFDSACIVLNLFFIPQVSIAKASNSLLSESKLDDMQSFAQGRAKQWVLVEAVQDFKWFPGRTSKQWQ